MNKLELILASNSKQRKDILDMVGFDYEIIKSPKEEKSNQTEPHKYVEEISYNKVLSVSKLLNKKAIIIAADTIVVMNDKIYEKVNFSSLFLCLFNLCRLQ